jgi:GAF domain-containing protein
MKCFADEKPDGLLTITSLSRALGGDARLSDVGSLLWMILRHNVPCDAMAVFLIDDQRSRVTVRFAAGDHAEAICGVSRPMGTGIAGAVSLTWKSVVNGDPALDLGVCAIDVVRPLRSCLAVPLVAGEALVAILALYSSAPNGFTDDHARLLDLVAPRLAASIVDVAIVEEDAMNAQGRAARSLQLVQVTPCITPGAPRPDQLEAPVVPAPRKRAVTPPAALRMPISMPAGPTG